MKKMNIIGLFAALTLAVTLMAVPVMAQTGYTSAAAAQSTRAAAAGITKEQALDIALKQAGVAKKSAEYISVYPDYEDGRPTFDVKFYIGMTEYHYEIDANSGQIIDADIDMEDRDMDFDDYFDD